MNYRYGITMIAPKGAFVPQTEIDAMLGFVGSIDFPDGSTHKTMTVDAFSVLDEAGNMRGITTWSDYLS